MAQLIEELIVGITTLKVKFLKSLRTSSISNANFILLEDSATPVVNAFETIDVTEDFNTISRLIALHYTNALQPLTTYRLTVTGLKDASGVVLADESVDFVTAASSSVPPINVEETPLVIEDHSVVEVIDTEANTSLIDITNPEFHIIGWVPEEPFIDPDVNGGRVTIKFSARPAGNYINKDYFKSQRKLVSRSMNRWQDIDTKVSIDGDRPWVYIDFPSIDATPVYTTPEHDYFESGYKYRIKVSKDVGT